MYRALRVNGSLHEESRSSFMPHQSLYCMYPYSWAHPRTSFLMEGLSGRKIRIAPSSDRCWTVYANIVSTKSSTSALFQSGTLVEGLEMRGTGRLSGTSAMIRSRHASESTRPPSFRCLIFPTCKVQHTTSIAWKTCKKPDHLAVSETKVGTA